MTEDMLYSKALSLRAKGLLSALEHMEGPFTLKAISGICREGRYEISSTLAELEDAGLLKRQKTKDDKGRFSGTIYIFAYDGMGKPPKMKGKIEAKTSGDTKTTKKPENHSQPDLFTEEPPAEDKKEQEDPVFIKLLYGNKGWDIPMSFVETMKKHYPDINVEQSIRDAAAWSIANEDITRNRKGTWKQYLNGWLRRNEEKAVSRNEARNYGRKTAPDRTNQYQDDDDIGVML